MKKIFFLLAWFLPFCGLSQETVEIAVTAKKGAFLKDAPDLDANILLKLADQSKVIIYDKVGNYYKVCVNEKCGFMSEVWIIEFTTEMLELDVRKKEEEEIKKLREEFKDEIVKDEYYKNKFGEEIFYKLKKKMYWIGMTAEMARVSLGEPNEINTTTGSWGEKQQWVYDNKYLYLENGKVVSFQN